MAKHFHGVAFENSFPAVNTKAIERTEKLLKTSLPEEYKEFLQTVNGGVPSPSEFALAESDQRACIDFFYGVGAKRERLDLAYQQQQMIGRTGGDMPEGFVAIGFDPGNAPYFISTKGEKAGAVFIFDPDGFLDPGRKPKLHLVTHRFLDMLDRLAVGK